jgi:glycerophosphoryl diester phosphodiesterase
MHDGYIDSTTTGKANVSDFTVDELKKFTLKAATGLATNERIPTLEEALLVAKGKILVNIDKGGTYIKEILVVIKNTETENQVIIKGTYPVDRIIADYGNEVGLLYMPIVSLESATAENTIKDFNSRFKPFAYEVIFRTEDNLVLKTMPNYIGNSRLWVSTLSGRMCANHNDELAIKNPDMHWGWILKQKITIIQTDRPTELIDYLKSKSKRNLKYNNK